MVPSFLLENLRLNNLSTTLRYRHGQWGANIPSTNTQISQPLLSERYDLIIGSALLYERDAPYAVAKFINRHATQHAEVWMVDADRGYRSSFNRQMATYNFTLCKENHLKKQLQSHTTAPYKGRLSIYRRIS